MRLLRRFVLDEGGANAIEYGLLAGLIGVVILVAVTNVGTGVSAKFNSVSGSLTP